MPIRERKQEIMEDSRLLKGLSSELSEEEGEGAAMD